jgi:hypothetical protein
MKKYIQKNIESFKVFLCCFLLFALFFLGLGLYDLHLVLDSLDKSMDLCYLLAKHNCDLSTHQVDDLALFKKDLKALIWNLVITKISMRVFYYHVYFFFLFA